MPRPTPGASRLLGSRFRRGGVGWRLAGGRGAGWRGIRCGGRGAGFDFRLGLVVWVDLDEDTHQRMVDMVEFTTAHPAVGLESKSLLCTGLMSNGLLCFHPSSQQKIQIDMQIAVYTGLDHALYLRVS